MNQQVVAKIQQQVELQLSTDELNWLIEAIEKIAKTDDPINELLNISVLVKRKISTQLSINETAVAHFDETEIIRLILLTSLLKYHPHCYNKTDLKACYQLGDSSEKCAFLKSLPLIDTEGIAVNVAIYAGRCNDLDEYSALALNNPYPAAFFPELNFNQTVLKSLFQGLDIDTVLGLKARSNENLSNMCFSYAIEQALADRVPPASLWLAVNYQLLTPEHQGEFQRYIQHFARQDAKHRENIEKLLIEQTLTHFKL